jgi:hypothetical protein
MMFRKGPWLGQVPLVLPRAGLPPAPRSRSNEPASSLREGGEIPATGGRVVKRIGFLWFFPNQETRDIIEAVTGQPVSESIEARVTMCNPTPGTFPALGDFVDPATGLNCFLDLPKEWRDAMLKMQFATLADYEGTPPYYGEWGVVDKGSGGYMKDCGKVGPFDTIEEAFSAAAEAAHEHGADLLPTDGWAQVKDSRGKGVGPIT